MVWAWVAIYVIGRLLELGPGPKRKRVGEVMRLISLGALAALLIDGFVRKYF
jgi:hypothetical protein